jgi:hypothetical protein
MGHCAGKHLVRERVDRGRVFLPEGDLPIIGFRDVGGQGHGAQVVELEGSRPRRYLVTRFGVDQ